MLPVSGVAYDDVDHSLLVGKLKTHSSASSSNVGPTSWHHYRNLWPTYFLLAIFTAVGVPIITSIQLARDPSVQYWIGRHGYVALLLPPYLLFLNGMLMRRGPKMIPIILSTMAPFLYVVVGGKFHLDKASVVAEMLYSSDCTTFVPKQDIHRSWVAAARIYEKCIERITAESGLNHTEGLKLYRLQECKEYIPEPGQEDIHAKHRTAWQYLRMLEEDHSCCGWCWETRPLWTFGEVRDACSAAAGKILMTKAVGLSNNMYYYGLACVIVSGAGVAFMGHEIRKGGNEWAHW